MEEMRARDQHTLQLAEKVDSMNFFSNNDTEQKLLSLENMVCDLEKMVCDLAKNKSSVRFDYSVMFLVIGLIVIGLVLIFT